MAEVKLNSRSNRFSKRFKLLKANEFKFVFNNAERIGNRHVTLLARANNLGYARIGLAISKKCARNATERNCIKRLFRESFRLNHHRLPAVDLVALCRPSSVALDKQELRLQIDRQWFYICKSFN